MEQLYHVIKQRFQKLDLVLQNKLNSQQFRDLKQQQKNRCQKQAWILSMFRSKKANITTNVKSNYYKYSYQIMRIIDPNFNCDVEPNLSDQTFLNDFVCLYTKFFDNYQDKFQFKVKIRNLLRPTNHNILNDMIKYLSDFSRDYIQHIYMWQFKQFKKLQQITQQKQKKLSISHSIQSAIYQTNSSTNSNLNPSQVKQKIFNSFRNSVNFSECSLKKNSQEFQVEINLRKNEFNRIYGILDVQPLPNFVFVDKMKTNIDVLRLRMNQLYRDLKFRNVTIKNSISLYFNQYHLKYNPTQVTSNLNNKQFLIQDNHPHISHPFRVSLIIQKNGFSCINIHHDQKFYSKEQRSLSPYKDKQRLSSLSGKQQSGSPAPVMKSSGKTQFVLNSLKVLRVSQNFLPPLSNYKQSIRISSQQQMRKNSRQNPKACSDMNSQNIINLQVQSAKEMESNVNNNTNGIIYYNNQLLRQAQRRKIHKKRIFELRKHFTSEDRNKNKSIKKNDPEEKIVQWLDKINIMKQLERKKILGLG